MIGFVRKRSIHILLACSLLLNAAEIVFAGDSLIGNGPWSELFSDIHNRGESRIEFTIDGGHLNDDAYLAIREPLAKFVVEDQPQKTSEAKPKP